MILTFLMLSDCVVHLKKKIEYKWNKCKVYVPVIHPFKYVWNAIWNKEKVRERNKERKLFLVWC